MIKMSETIKEFEKGSIESTRMIRQSDLNSEWGIMEASLVAMFQNILKFKEEGLAVAKKLSAGDIDAVIYEKSHEGIYKDLTRVFNGITDLYNKDMNEIMEVLNQFGQGDFRGSVRPFPGKKVKFSQGVETLRMNLQGAVNEWQSVVTAVVEGRKPLTATRASGNWAKMARDMELVLENYNKPIKEVSDILNRMAAGDLTQTASADYKGEMALLRQSLNKAAGSLNEHVKEIAAQLHELSGSGTNRIRKEYMGPFSAVRDAFRDLDNKLTQLEKAANTTEPLTPRLRTGFTPGTPTAKLPPRPAVNTTRLDTVPKTAKDGGFTPAMPAVTSRSRGAPNASYIYDSKDFGKYK
jgi:methyl-accepting chemotaxis protein